MTATAWALIVEKLVPRIGQKKKTHGTPIVSGRCANRHLYYRRIVGSRVIPFFWMPNGVLERFQ